MLIKLRIIYFKFSLLPIFSDELLSELIELLEDNNEESLICLIFLFSSLKLLFIEYLYISDLFFESL